MAAALASARFSPFFRRRAVRFGPLALAASHSLQPLRTAATLGAIAAPQPQQQLQALHATTWTAEEQLFLRALREAGL